MMIRVCVALSLSAGAVVSPALGRGVMEFGPSAYQSFADSAFNGLPFTYFFLEDFEDGNLNTPDAFASNGFVVAPGASTDSVDGDDGAIDGFGNNGRSWYPNQSSVTFTFDDQALPSLPTHVGLVWTDVGIVPGGVEGFTDVTVQFFDAASNEVARIMAPGLGDGNVLGGTGEDRFFGAFNPGGIERVQITVSGSVDWEVDHLQYGIIVPAPGAAALMFAGMPLMRRRRAV